MEQEGDEFILDFGSFVYSSKSFPQIDIRYTMTDVTLNDICCRSIKCVSPGVCFTRVFYSHPAS